MQATLMPVPVAPSSCPDIAAARDLAMTCCECDTDVQAREMQLLQARLEETQLQRDRLAAEVASLRTSSAQQQSPGPPPILLDLVSDGAIPYPELRLEQLAEVIERQGLLVFVHQFSELQPGETLQEHVQRHHEAGTLSHPSQLGSLVFACQRLLALLELPNFQTMQQTDASFWSARPGVFSSATFNNYTPLHLIQEWQTTIKNLLNGDNTPYVLRAVLPGIPGKRKALPWNICNASCVLLGDDGRRYWGWIRQVWPADLAAQLRWSLRDIHSNKLTLFCTTYCDYHTGAILSQNATSMAMFGSHGFHNAESGSRRVSSNPGSHNFLEMLFEARKEALASVPQVVGQEVFRIDGLEIVNPTLRSWMGVKPGQEVFHDVQIVSNTDPLTMQPVYAISQIDCTERVLAQRQLQQTLEELAEDKEHMAALMRRQQDLIACLGKLNAMETAVGSSSGSTLTDTLDTMRREIHQSSSAIMMADSQDPDEIKKLELLGAGTFGKVYRALWKGKTVAVKSMLLPLDMSSGKKQEAMAVMEAAVSSSLKHPNVVQTYTYSMRPVRTLYSRRSTAESLQSSKASRADDPEQASETVRVPRRSNMDGEDVRLPRRSDVGGDAAETEISGFEVQLVLELCDRGSLRQALDQKVFHAPSGQLDYLAVLETAADIARGMQHLHSLNTWHSDLKALNTLLASADTRRGFTAKVSDFGLSLKVDADQASVSGSVQGTGPYIAPEVYTSGTRSAAADVYAFGITLWELLTAGEPLHTVPRVMLAQQVVVNHLRPTFPPGAPAAYVALAERCWDPLPSARPTFDEVLSCLADLITEAPATIPLSALSSDASRGDSSGGDYGLLAMQPLAELETPVQRMLVVLEQLMLGRDVDAREASMLHEAISGSRDVLQPTNLVQRMQSLQLDNEVSRSLLTMLSGPEATVVNSPRFASAPVPALRPVEENDRESRISSSTDPLAEAEQPDDSGAALALLKAPGDRVQALLAGADRWCFDPFELDEATEGHPLSTLAFALMRRLKLAPLQGEAAELKLARYLRCVEEGYRQLPYHNRMHATAVLHSTYTILTTGNVLHTAWTTDHDTVLMTALFAAAVHDYEHLGLTNDFLVKTKHQLALLYNDRSPMEQHHVAAAFTLLQRQDLDFTGDLPDRVQVAFRKQAIDMVLATDMKQHFAMLSLFQNKFGAPAAIRGTAAGSRNSRVQSLQHSARFSHIGGSRDGGLGLDEDTLSLVLQMTLKCADLSSLASAVPVHRRWAERLEQEYWIQGDRERDAGLPISPLMDRHCPKGGVTRSQTGFFKVVGMPLFETFCNAFPTTGPLLAAVKENFAMWQRDGK